MRSTAPHGATRTAGMWAALTAVKLPVSTSMASIAALALWRCAQGGDERVQPGEDLRLLVSVHA